MKLRRMTKKGLLEAAAMLQAHGWKVSARIQKCGDLYVLDVNRPKKPTARPRLRDEI